jgi:hypothetical protein
MPGLALTTAKKATSTGCFVCYDLIFFTALFDENYFIPTLF